MSSQLTELVIIELACNHGQIEGMEHLSCDLLGYSNAPFVRRKLVAMQSQKLLQIIRGNGRGNKSIIRLPHAQRKNRNSPGSPRRVR